MGKRHRKLKIVLTVAGALVLLVLVGLQTAVVVYPSIAASRFAARTAEAPDQGAQLEAAQLANERMADAVLVLGYAIENGARPDPWSEARLREGMRLYRSGAVGKIIVSGGQGPKDSVPVGMVMRQWLVDNGVPEADVFAETEAHSTVANFRFSKEIADANAIKHMIVTTNGFHLFRSFLIGREEMPDALLFVSADIPMDTKKMIAYLKEPIAILRYWLLGQ